MKSARVPVILIGLFQLWKFVPELRVWGYGVGQSIRLYGEQFEVISDPFPERDGIAVKVTVRQGQGSRVLQLPATVLQSVKVREFYVRGI